MTTVSKDLPKEVIFELPVVKLKDREKFTKTFIFIDGHKDYPNICCN